MSNSAFASAERKHLAEPEHECERCGDPITHTGPLCAPCEDAEYWAKQEADEERREP
jgi:hypothetical protein